jgi:hypothetical protein
MSSDSRYLFGEKPCDDEEQDERDGVHDSPGQHTGSADA